MAVRDGQPHAPVSSTPAIAGFPASIARAGLGAVASGGGSSTVTFGTPDGVPEYVPFSTTPVTVSRWPDLPDVGGMAQDAMSGARERAEGALSDAGSAVRGRAEGALDDVRSAATQRASSAIDSAAAAAKGMLPGGADQGAPDPDKAFEELYDRLKRELLIEQEQLGQLFREP
jgi:hypothetical protein